MSVTVGNEVHHKAAARTTRLLVDLRYRVGGIVGRWEVGGPIYSDCRIEADSDNHTHPHTSDSHAHTHQDLDQDPDEDAGDPQSYLDLNQNEDAELATDEHRHCHAAVDSEWRIRSQH